jgi:type IV secretion system protein TrbL
MTQSPYAAYHIGTRGGKHLIGPGAEEHPVGSADEGDVDWSAHRARDSSPSSAPPWGEDSGGEPSETV